MSNNVEQQTIIVNNEIFINGTYNGISVIIRQKDGFINATAMCKQFAKRFRKIFENHAWQAYLEEFKHEYYGSPEMGGPMNELRKGYNNLTQGTYIDPRLWVLISLFYQYTEARLVKNATILIQYYDNWPRERNLHYMSIFGTASPLHRNIF